MGRAPCCSKVGLNRGPWTPEEDTLLSKYIESHGEGNWRALPKAAGLLRCGKSCRLRWVNYLRPNVKRGNISEDEEDLIVMLHALLGNRWSLIAARMPGRTDNEIKNYWNTHLSKKLASKGLDPKTHKPLVKLSTPAATAEATAAAAAAASADDSAAKSKSSEGSSSSSSSSDDQQEAWETTMDLDTSSYSTGSYSSVKQRQRKLPKQLRQNMPQVKEVRQHMPKEQSLNLKVPATSCSLFACSSPSSVLNFHHSPSASSDDSSRCSPMSNSHSSSCLSQQSEHEQQMDGMESCWEELSNNDTMLFDVAAAPAQSPSPSPAAAAADCVASSDAQQMLQFIDDFLCSSSKEESGIFTSNGSSNEFWDSLERIEPPTSLWEELGDISGAAAAAASAAATTRVTTSDDLLQPDASASQPCSFQDSISELLFAC